jgi:hypothetical protein
MKNPNNSLRDGRDRLVSGKGMAVIGTGVTVLLCLVFAPSVSKRPDVRSAANSALHPQSASTSTESLSTSRNWTSEVKRRPTGPSDTSKARMQRLEELMQQTQITPEQLATYLEANQRNAASLLAAAGITDDKEFLREALEKFPNDPRVAYTAWARAEKPEERIEWLTRFKQVDAANSLPNYLLANELFKTGRTDAALAELETAWSKPAFSDYGQESIQDRLEAYTAAGLGDVEATALAWSQHPLPHLAKLKELGRAMEDLGAAYAQGNDPESAIAARQMVRRLSDRLTTGHQFLINDLVGMAIEMHMLNHLEPTQVVTESGATAAQRVAEISREREGLRQRSRVAEQALSTASDQDILAYFNRVRLFGESAATDWLAGKHGIAPAAPGSN